MNSENASFWSATASELLQKSTFSATKMKIYRLGSSIKIIARKYSISKAGVNNRFALKVHIFSDKNRVLPQKSTFLATKMIAERTDDPQTSIHLIIVLL